jgi:hypothetical protein
MSDLTDYVCPLGNFYRFKNHKNRYKGTISFRNGDVYYGSWQNGVKCCGEMLYADGSTYYGSWLNGQFEGYGIYMCSKYMYEGTFVKGKKHGMGVYTRNGYKYIGEWRDGTFHNNGILYGPESERLLKVLFDRGVFMNMVILK